MTATVPTPAPATAGAPPGRLSDVAVVGSPSTNTELTVDLLQEATEERLVGALVHFGANQDGRQVHTVGQITSIELRNRWHEDSVFRNLIKRTGDIPPVTARQDTRTATLAVGSTFRRSGDGYDPEVLGMVPPTGTIVSRVDQSLLDRLLAHYHDEIFYLGRAYANDVLYPMWFKHYGQGPRGAGEAYHTGIFGKTGSGKSGLAKYLLAGYARHPELGILLIDPQGEFSLEAGGTRVGQQGFQLDEAMRALRRPVQRYGIRDLQLDGWDLFEELLVALRFTHRALGIPPASTTNAETAATVIVKALKKAGHKLSRLNTREALTAALHAARSDANKIYSGKERAQQLQERVDEQLAALAETGRDAWAPICQLFTEGPGRRRVYGIVDDLVSSEAGGQARPLVVVDLSQNGADRRVWSEDLQQRVLGLLLDALVRAASESLSSRRSANTLVVLDEAHRHAPSGTVEPGSQAQRLKATLRQAVRETRKFGVGWCFISQTLGGIDNEILQQLRTLFFGFGLSLGDEFRKLGEFVGGDRNAMALYQSFRDPQSAPRRELREFPFMSVGPVSLLSHSGRPLFFSAFTDPAEFAGVNGLAGRATPPPRQ